LKENLLAGIELKWKIREKEFEKLKEDSDGKSATYKAFLSEFSQELSKLSTGSFKDRKQTKDIVKEYQKMLNDSKDSISQEEKRTLERHFKDTQKLINDSLSKEVKKAESKFNTTSTFGRADSWGSSFFSGSPILQFMGNAVGGVFKSLEERRNAKKREEKVLEENKQRLFQELYAQQLQQAQQAQTHQPSTPNIPPAVTSNPGVSHGIASAPPSLSQPQQVSAPPVPPVNAIASGVSGAISSGITSGVHQFTGSHAAASINSAQTAIPASTPVAASAAAPAGVSGPLYGVDSYHPLIFDLRASEKTKLKKHFKNLKKGIEKIDQSIKSISTGSGSSSSAGAGGSGGVGGASGGHNFGISSLSSSAGAGSSSESEPPKSATVTKYIEHIDENLNKYDPKKELDHTTMVAILKEYRKIVEKKVTNEEDKENIKKHIKTNEDYLKNIKRKLKKGGVGLEKEKGKKAKKTLFWMADRFTDSFSAPILRSVTGVAAEWFKGKIEKSEAIQKVKEDAKRNLLFDLAEGEFEEKNDESASTAPESTAESTASSTAPAPESTATATASGDAGSGALASLVSPITSQTENTDAENVTEQAGSTTAGESIVAASGVAASGAAASGATASASESATATLVESQSDLDKNIADLNSTILETNELLKQFISQHGEPGSPGSSASSTAGGDSDSNDTGSNEETQTGAVGMPGMPGGTPAMAGIMGGGADAFSNNDTGSNEETQVGDDPMTKMMKGMGFGLDGFGAGGLEGALEKNKETIWDTLIKLGFGTLIGGTGIVGTLKGIKMFRGGKGGKGGKTSIGDTKYVGKVPTGTPNEHKDAGIHASALGQKNNVAVTWNKENNTFEFKDETGKLWAASNPDNPYKINQIAYDIDNMTTKQLRAVFTPLEIANNPNLYEKFTKREFKEMIDADPFLNMKENADLKKQKSKLASFGGPVGKNAKSHAKHLLEMKRQGIKPKNFSSLDSHEYVSAEDIKTGKPTGKPNWTNEDFLKAMYGDVGDRFTIDENGKVVLKEEYKNKISKLKRFGKGSKNAAKLIVAVYVGNKLFKYFNSDGEEVKEPPEDSETEIIKLNAEDDDAVTDNNINRQLLEMGYDYEENFSGSSITLADAPVNVTYASSETSSSSNVSSSSVSAISTGLTPLIADSLVPKDAPPLVYLLAASLTDRLAPLIASSITGGNITGGNIAGGNFGDFSGFLTSQNLMNVGSNAGFNAGFNANIANINNQIDDVQSDVQPDSLKQPVQFNTPKPKYNLSKDFKLGSDFSNFTNKKFIPKSEDNSDNLFDRLWNGQSLDILGNKNVADTRLNMFNDEDTNILAESLLVEFSQLPYSEFTVRKPPPPPEPAPAAAPAASSKVSWLKNIAKGTTSFAVNMLGGIGGAVIGGKIDNRDMTQVQINKGKTGFAGLTVESAELIEFVNSEKFKNREIDLFNEEEAYLNIDGENVDFYTLLSYIANGELSSDYLQDIDNALAGLKAAKELREYSSFTGSNFYQSTMQATGSGLATGVLATGGKLAAGTGWRAALGAGAGAFGRSIPVAALGWETFQAITQSVEQGHAFMERKGYDSEYNLWDTVRYFNPFEIGEHVGLMKNFIAEMIGDEIDDDFKKDRAKNNVLEHQILMLAAKYGTLENVPDDEMNKLLSKRTDYMKIGLFDKLRIFNENGELYKGDKYDLLKTKEGRKMIQNALLPNIRKEIGYGYGSTLEKLPSAEQTFAEYGRINENAGTDGGEVFDAMIYMIRNAQGHGSLSKQDINDMNNKFNLGETQIVNINNNKRQKTQKLVGLISLVTGESYENTLEKVKSDPDNDGSLLGDLKAAQKLATKLHEENITELVKITNNDEIENQLNDTISNDGYDPNDIENLLAYSTGILKSIPPNIRENTPGYTDSYTDSAPDIVDSNVSSGDQLAQLTPESSLTDFSAYSGSSFPSLYSLEDYMSQLRDHTNDLNVGVQNIVNTYNNQSISSSGGGGGRSFLSIINSAPPVGQ
jgi:hypothetical protein